jgi:hypothetical protein
VAAAGLGDEAGSPRWTTLEPPAQAVRVVRVGSGSPGLYDLRTIRVEVARSIAGIAVRWSLSSSTLRFPAL